MPGGGGASGVEQWSAKCVFVSIKPVRIVNPAFSAHFQLLRNLAQTLRHPFFHLKSCRPTHFFTVEQNFPVASWRWAATPLHRCRFAHMDTGLDFYCPDFHCHLPCHLCFVLPIVGSIAYVGLPPSLVAWNQVLGNHLDLIIHNDGHGHCCANMWCPVSFVFL